MTLDDPTTPTGPRRRGARRDGEVPGMTEAEKLAAQWEARHDVAARGRRGAPDVLQHYLAHERLVERSGAGMPAAARSRRSGLLGWLRRGRSSPSAPGTVPVRP